MSWVSADGVPSGPPPRRFCRRASRYGATSCDATARHPSRGSPTFNADDELPTCGAVPFADGVTRWRNTLVREQHIPRLTTGCGILGGLSGLQRGHGIPGPRQSSCGQPCFEMRFADPPSLHKAALLEHRGPQLVALVRGRSASCRRRRRTRWPPWLVPVNEPSPEVEQRVRLVRPMTDRHHADRQWEGAVRSSSNRVTCVNRPSSRGSTHSSSKPCSRHDWFESG